MDDLLKMVKTVMEEKIGVCEEKGEVLRTYARNLGQYDGIAIVEASWVDFRRGAKNSQHVLQIYSTLAQNIEDEIVPELKEKLTDLNSVTMLGSYGYYKPLRQIYHCYRLPVGSTITKEMIMQIGYCLEQIRRQLDVFGDYVMILADDPNEISLVDYVVGVNAGAIMEECIGVLNQWFDDEE